MLAGRRPGDRPGGERHSRGEEGGAARNRGHSASAGGWHNPSISPGAIARLAANYGMRISPDPDAPCGNRRRDSIPAEPWRWRAPGGDDEGVGL